MEKIIISFDLFRIFKFYISSSESVVVWFFNYNRNDYDIFNQLEYIIGEEE